MFCNEPIEKVHLGHIETDGHYSNSFFERYYRLVYHVEQGERIILETQHHVISIDVNGVALLLLPMEPVSEYEVIDPCIIQEEGEDDWVQFESTLFVGEHLCEVKKQDNHFLLIFDDFELTVKPYEEDEIVGYCHHYDFHRILGCDRLIKRRCSCGGQGELLIDFVNDYVVRCKECHRSTCAEMTEIEAINEWNNGETCCVVETGIERMTECLQNEPLRYIAIPRNHSRFLDDNLCDTDRLIFAFEKNYFFLSCIRTHDQGTTFTAEHFSDYNRQLYPYEIHPYEDGGLRFVAFENIGDFAGMLLRLDDAELFISTDVDGTLTIGTGCDDTALTEPKRRELILGMTFD